MQVAIGKAGLEKSWQGRFPEEVDCPYCDGTSRIAFVAYEALDGTLQPPPGEVNLRDANGQEFVCTMHENDPKDEGYWLHDCCAVAVYFCKKCLHPAAEYNQA